MKQGTYVEVNNAAISHAINQTSMKLMIPENIPLGQGEAWQQLIRTKHFVIWDGKQLHWKEQPPRTGNKLGLEEFLEFLSGICEGPYQLGPFQVRILWDRQEVRNSYNGQGWTFAQIQEIAERTAKGPSKAA